MAPTIKDIMRGEVERIGSEFDGIKSSEIDEYRV